MKLGGRSGQAFFDMFKIFMMAMVTTTDDVNMEYWTKMTDRRDGSGQVMECCIHIDKYYSSM